ncbi:MAG: helix-turn-helix domain-containing protein [Oscillospiraceae bacterium]|nr:helix-turn-helix domain-containing protein [Oscillospiraceae bacterium]
MTQVEIAKHLKVSRQAYSFYELGKNEMDFKSLCKLADLYSVTTDYLLGRYDTKPFLLDNDSEIELVIKYRTLDERGKLSVNVVVENEYSYTCNKKIIKKPAI